MRAATRLWPGCWLPTFRQCPGTPQERIDILARAMEQAMASEAVQQYMERAGSNPLSQTGEEAQQFVRDQTEIWGGIIQAAGIEPQ